MATTSDIRKGLCIRYNNDIYKIVEFLHVKPGKGPAFVRTKLKSVTSGKVIDNTFSAGHKIEDVRVETHKFQYLYNEGETYHFMNTDDYNQITLQREALDTPELLKEGEIVTIIIRTSDELPLAAAVARVSATEAYENAATENVQVHGGMGYTRYKPFEHIYRHHRRYRITEGSEEIQMRKVGQHLFGFITGIYGNEDGTVRHDVNLDGATQ